MIRRHPRQRRAVHSNLHQCRTRCAPDLIQCKQWKAGGKGAQMGGFGEVPAQAAQRAAPQEPFVEIAQQHGNTGGPSLEPVHQSIDLLAALSGTESEVGSHNVQYLAVFLQDGVDGATGFLPFVAEVHTVDFADRQRGEDGVAVVSIISAQRGAGNGLVTGLSCEVVQYVDILEVSVMNLL